jgi:hypothetical protein
LIIKTGYLTKFLYLLGESSLKELIYLEEKHKEEKKELSKKLDEKKATRIEEELGNDELEQIDDKYDFKHKELLSKEYFYFKYLKIVLAVCNDSKNEFKSSIIRKIGIITLCKFMCTHRDVCEENIKLLFSLLKKSSSNIKGNIIISIGDLSW